MLGHMLVYKAGIQLPRKMSPGPTQAWNPLMAPWEVAGTRQIRPAADWNKAQGRVPSGKCIELKTRLKSWAVEGRWAAEGFRGPPSYQAPVG